MARFRYIYSAYKILYFLQSIRQRGKNTPHKTDKAKRMIISKANNVSQLAYSVASNIKAKSTQYLIVLSALDSELSYLRKYMVFDRKSFTEQWSTHEKKQSEWIWAQIRKKWVKKEGAVWINEGQKEVNAEKYVDFLIEQTYMKEYERF